MWELGNIIINGIITGSIYVLLAIGFSLVFSVSGVLNLAQGAFVTLGALVLYTLLVVAHWPLPLALVGSVVLVAGVAAMMEWWVIRPALGHISHTNLLMLMGGFLTFFEGAAFLIWGSTPYSLPPFSGQRPWHLGQLFIPTQAVWVVGSAVIIVIALWWGLTRTTWGKALRACAANPQAARLMGIPVDRLVLVTFAASGALGAIAGAMFVPLTSLDFTTMANYTNAGLIAVTLGGLGNFLGSIIGGLSLGTAEQLLSGYVSSLFSTALSILALMAFLVWRPQGFLGRVQGNRVDVVTTTTSRFFFLPRLPKRWNWGLAIAWALAMLALPYGLAGSGLLRLVNITGIFTLTVIGLDVLTGVAGQVSLGQAGFMAIGGYTAAILTLQGHWPPVLAIVAGVIFSIIVAIILSFASGRVRGMYLAVLTLAFGIFVEALGNGLQITGGPSGLIGIPSFTIAGISFASNVHFYYLIWGLVGVALVVLANLVRTGRGRAWRVLHLDQTGAQALGVDLRRAKMQAFVVAAVLASVAGSLYGFYFHYLAPTMVGSSASLEMMTMMVVGGAGSLIGPVIGTALLAFLPQISQTLAAWEPLMDGLLLVVFLRYLPGGLYGAFVTGLSKLTRPRRMSKSWAAPREASPEFLPTREEKPR